MAAVRIGLLASFLFCRTFAGGMGVTSTSHASGLRTCQREKSENLGIVGDLTRCLKCKNKKIPANRCPVSQCKKTATVHDDYEGLFIDKKFLGCNMKATDQCFKRGIQGVVRFRLRRSCVLRNKAKKFDFTVHINIPDELALGVSKNTKLSILGENENKTRTWMSPNGNEIIFNINEVSWKDLHVFQRADASERAKPTRDVIVERKFNLAPLTAGQKGFKTKYFKELNFARNGSADQVNDKEESSFYICKQDHVHANVVTERFWQQKVFSGIVTGGHAHSVTYKMIAVFVGFVLFIVVLCLSSALMTIKKQTSDRKAREAAKMASREELIEK